MLRCRKALTRWYTTKAAAKTGPSRGTTYGGCEKMWHKIGTWIDRRRVLQADDDKVVYGPDNAKEASFYVLRDISIIDSLTALVCTHVEVDDD